MLSIDMSVLLLHVENDVELDAGIQPKEARELALKMPVLTRRPAKSSRRQVTNVITAYARQEMGPGIE